MVDSNDAGHGGERALLAAVILQAIDDLSDKDETVRFEAHEFFLQQHGGWAEQRRFYFGALGLEESSVLTALAGKLAPPERPERRWTASDLLGVLPTERFSATALAGSLRRGYTQVRGMLQILEQKGLVVRTGRGEFCRTECHRPDPVPPPAPDTRRIVLDALRDGPKTVREIVFATDGEIGEDVIRRHLAEAMGECVVDYDLPRWSLRKTPV